MRDAVTQGFPEFRVFFDDRRQMFDHYRELFLDRHFFILSKPSSLSFLLAIILFFDWFVLFLRLGFIISFLFHFLWFVYYLIDFLLKWLIAISRYSILDLIVNFQIHPGSKSSVAACSLHQLGKLSCSTW
jgi:hypothetical protein